MLLASGSGFSTAATAFGGQHFSLLDIKRSLYHFPFVKAAFAQTAPLEFVLEAGLFKLNHIAHILA